MKRIFNIFIVLTLVAAHVFGLVESPPATGNYPDDELIASHTVRPSIFQAYAAATAPKLDTTPYKGKIITRAPFKTNRVAITFDDGPSKYSLELLNKLRSANIKATFFYVGSRIPGKEDFFKKFLNANGFEWGNHSYDHIDMNTIPYKAQYVQMKDTASLLEKYTGQKPVYFRPPAGHYNKSTTCAAASNNELFVMWDVHGFDTWGISAKEIAAGVVSRATGGSIILLHETNPETLKALPTIITGLKRKGLKPGTLTELLTPPK